MTKLTQPSEIARETLRQLAQKRRPPTPDNYRVLYHEIAGTAAAETFPERSLKVLAGALPRKTAEQTRFARQIDGAVSAKNWDGLKAALVEVMEKTAAEPPPWAVLIRDLMTQIEARHAELTTARKREALDHVLAASGTPEMLYGRLQSLLRSWSQGKAGGDGVSLVDDVAAASAEQAPAAAVSQLTSTQSELRQAGPDQIGRAHV